MKLLSILLLAPLLFLIGCDDDPDPVIQTYTLKIIDLQGVIESDADDFRVEISNIYSSDEIDDIGQIAVITDEGDYQPITFTFIDDLGFEMFSASLVVSNFENPIHLKDDLGNFITFTYTSTQSDTIIISPPIQTYTMKVIALEGVVPPGANNFFVEISNIYSSDTIEDINDIALITDENDNVPMTFTFVDDLDNEIVSFTTTITDFDNPIVLDDGEGNKIVITYTILLEI